MEDAIEEPGILRTGNRAALGSEVSFSGWFTVEGGGRIAVTGGDLGPGNEVMMAYGGAGGSAMGASTGGGDVLGSTGDYSPQGTPTSLTGHSNVVDGSGPYGGPAANYSPQDSPVSSVGGATGNGQVPSFGFTQEQVACVCEVWIILIFQPLINTLIP